MNKDIMRKVGFENEVTLVENFICPMCKTDLAGHKFRDKLSLKEFTISGLCQKCQDNIFD